MLERLIRFSLTQRLFVSVAGLVLMCSGLYAFHILDVVAYPDPSPPMIEIITQYPGWSSEQIERAITLPIEIGLQGMPGLTDIRSLSIFVVHFALWRGRAGRAHSREPHSRSDRGRA